MGCKYRINDACIFAGQADFTIDIFQPVSIRSIESSGVRLRPNSTNGARTRLSESLQLFRLTPDVVEIAAGPRFRLCGRSPNTLHRGDASTQSLDGILERIICDRVVEGVEKL